MRLSGNCSLMSALPPKADKIVDVSACPLCAKSGHFCQLSSCRRLSIKLEWLALLFDGREIGRSGHFFPPGLKRGPLLAIVFVFARFKRGVGPQKKTIKKNAGIPP